MGHESIVTKPMTVRDIARQAGVSTATVSRVLNGKRVVRKETREKVLTILSTTEYSINLNAAALGRRPRSVRQKQDHKALSRKRDQLETSIMDVLNWIESEAAVVGRLIEELASIQRSLRALSLSSRNGKDPAAYKPKEY